MSATLRLAKRDQQQGDGLAAWLIETARLLWSRGSAQRGRAAERQMKLVETLALGGRKQLLLVTCCGENFLVGTGEDSVRTIVRIGSGANQTEEEHAPCR